MLKTARKITEQGLGKINSGLLPAVTLIMSSRAPVGYLAFSTNAIAINQGFIAIIDNKGVSNFFIYLWLLSNIERVKNYSNGSTFQEISKLSFKQISITKPDKNTRNRFEKVIDPLFQKILSNTHHIHTLTNLRYTLLPQLMSGTLRLKL